MKKTMKKILCSLLVVVMCFTSAPLQGFVGLDWGWLDFSMRANAANELAVTGQCGDDVFWNYNSETGELVISGSGTMYDYTYTSSAPFTYNNIKNVVIEEGITTIGKNAFYGCGMIDITIPSSVQIIRNSAITYCHNLKNLYVPSGVISVESGGVLDCGGLVNIYISDSVENIEERAFVGCEKLEKINVDENNDFYCSDENGILFTKDKSKLIQYPLGCKSVSFVVPNSVKTIANGAFEESPYIQDVVIPDGVININDRAFYFCDNLISVNMADSVINVGEMAFEGCYKLSQVVLSKNITYINALTFGSCYALDKIDVPENVTSIGDSAFSYCKSLKEIYLPNSLSQIGSYAFRDCDSLENVILPENVKKIGECAFVSCDRLKNVTLSIKLDMIDTMTFRYCSMLESIVMFNNLKSIGKWAFDGCSTLKNVYYTGTEEQWDCINISSTSNDSLTNATIHYNYKPAPTSYFMVSSDQYSVDSIHRNEAATYKVHLLDENSDFLPVDEVIVQNNTLDIVNISTNKVSDTELELTVEPLKDGDASISLFNGDSSLEQFFNFTVYSNTTTYRADQVPVTNEKLKTNFSRGDLTVDNFEYIFDENKGKYIATMDVYNSSGAIGVVAAYTQDGLISDIEQVDPYVPLPGDFGEFLVYLGSGAVGILKGENWNYRFAGDSQKTSIEIEVPEDGYLTVSCDVTADNAAFIYNLVSIGVDFVFKTAEVIDVLGTDTDKLAKDTTKTLAKKVSEYFNEDSEWTKGAIKKLAKKLSKQFNMAYLEEISVLSLEMLDEMYKNVGEDFSDAVLDVIIDLTKEEIKEFGVMAAAKKLVKDKVIGTAEKTLLKAASIMFDSGSYINLLNSILGAYRYNVGTGKTMVVFKPNGEDGFLCKDTVKVISDVITDEVLLNHYVIVDNLPYEAFVRNEIYPNFNLDDDLDDREISIDLNRVVEIHEISLIKNGKEIDTEFKATVEMNIPYYLNSKTCSVYRVEKDGTYTKLDTTIQGNKIIFETDHFSQYILTGIRNDIEGTTPCDEHVYEEVRTEPSCTEAGSITYTCYCGDTYTETIEANGHTDSKWIVDKDSTCSAEGSKHIECTVCEEVLKTEAIAKLSHNYSSVVTEATCETGGYTTYTCTCGDTYTGDKTPAKGHDYAKGVCKNCGDSKVDNCSCNCHKSGFMGFIWKILRFFYKLFGTNKTCDCGVTHY